MDIEKTVDNLDMEITTAEASVVIPREVDELVQESKDLMDAFYARAMKRLENALKD